MAGILYNEKKKFGQFVFEAILGNEIGNCYNMNMRHSFAIS